MSGTSQGKAQRPLSPHLQVYRPQMTSVLSILHRATGVALSIGLLYFTGWLVAAAMGEAAYDAYGAFCASPLGLFMLLGWTVAFYYHLANGLRHLFWDCGQLLTIKKAYAAGYCVLAFTVIATALTWACILAP